MIQAASDQWLAQVMSRPAYRISGLLAPAEADQLGAALAMATTGRAFAHARVPTHEVFTVQALESAGFRIVDSGVTFAMKSPAIQSDAKAPVRFAEKRDEGEVSRLARNAFKYSRFHLDPLVPREQADEIKAQWAANYFQGKRGDFMVVAERAGEIAGFLQLLKASSDMLVIDLIAVAEKHRGHGLATQMIRFAVCACGSFGRLQVGTQAANVGSLQFYQRFGFGIMATSYVLHCHGPQR